MKTSLKITLFIFCITLIVQLVNANTVEFPSDLIYIDEWYEVDVIRDDPISTEDLDVAVGIRVIVPPQYTKLYHNLTITFIPFEFIYTGIEKEVDIEVCVGTIRSADFTRPDIEVDCKERVKHFVAAENYIKSGSKYFKKYKITISMQEVDRSKIYVIKITYTLPNFIKRQGIYHIAWFNTRVDSVNFEKFVILPKETSILERVPKNTKINSFVTSENHDDIWYLIIREDGKKQLWYTDENELFWRNIKIILLGVFLGWMLGLIRRKDVVCFFCKLKKKKSRRKL
jgi:hypothetical protein